MSDRRRDVFVVARLRPWERAAAKRAAERAGESVSSYIRALILADASDRLVSTAGPPANAKRAER